MKRWGDLSQDTTDHLSAGAVLDQAELAVVVTDRFSNVLYWNPFAEQLFGRPGYAHGRDDTISISIMERDHPLGVELAKHVLKGNVWEGTFDVVRHDGTLIYVRAQAVPMRHTSGSVTGIVITAREAMKSNEREKDRFGLLERIGERLAGSLYVEETLNRVAEMLVPQFADHCFIELMEGERLVRKVSTHVGGWQPPADSWKPVGAEIRYPIGHYADSALRRQETILVEDFSQVSYPSLSEGAARVDGEIGVTSAIVAPLLRPRRGPRADVPVDVQPDRPALAPLRRLRPRLRRGHRHPGRHRRRQRPPVRGGAPHRRVVPEAPAAA